MKQRLFEDDQIYDVQRQTTGMGSEIAKPEPITVNNISQQKKSDEIIKNKLFPIDAIEQTIGDAFVSISNVNQLIQTARNNPTLEESKLIGLQDILKDMTKLLVDFDESLAKIKGNVK